MMKTIVASFVAMALCAAAVGLLGFWIGKGISSKMAVTYQPSLNSLSNDLAWLKTITTNNADAANMMFNEVGKGMQNLNGRVMFLESNIYPALNQK